VDKLDTRVPSAASGVTQKNARTGRRCPRCHRWGVFAVDSIVCQRCVGTPPLLVTVRVSVTRTTMGGDR
jgi:hypothetical protein